MLASFFLICSVHLTPCFFVSQGGFCPCDTWSGGQLKSKTRLLSDQSVICPCEVVTGFG